MIKTRGPKKGECNICGNFTDLTEDHTPPKGCYKPRAVELIPITDHLRAEPPKKKQISQNGVKYRTLCGHCNNNILGQECDPDLISFTNSISTILKSSINLPPILNIEAKPQNIMKSVIGHLCAQGVGRYQKGNITLPIKNYMLGSEELLPEEIKIYCWPYPYSKNILVRDCALMDLTIHEPVILWLMKFFPVSFLVTFNEPDPYKFSVLELSRWRNTKFNETVTLPFNINNVPHQYWPEAPHDNTIILYGQEAISSSEKRLTNRSSNAPAVLDSF
ncbi:MAG: hypothetical protein Q7T74_06410 [Candidatus Saccharibacteria bacterium]|nr:hypothetical protein [Candidatus Saccharibacteria bacterium]